MFEVSRTDDRLDNKDETVLAEVASVVVVGIDRRSLPSGAAVGLQGRSRNGTDQIRRDRLVRNGLLASPK